MSADTGALLCVFLIDYFPLYSTHQTLHAMASNRLALRHQARAMWSEEETCSRDKMLNQQQFQNLKVISIQSHYVWKIMPSTDETLPSGHGNVKAMVAELSTNDDRRQRPTARPPPVPQRTVGPLSVVSESSATTRCTLIIKNIRAYSLQCRSVAYGADSPDAISSMHDDAVPMTTAETPPPLLTNGCPHSDSSSQQICSTIIAIFDSCMPISTERAINLCFSR